MWHVCTCGLATLAPEDLHFVIGDFSLGSPEVRSRDLPIKSQWRNTETAHFAMEMISDFKHEQYYCYTCWLHNPVRQCLIFAKATFYDNMYNFTRVIWAYHKFSSIPPDQIEQESREGRQCAHNCAPMLTKLPSRMICSPNSLVQCPDLPDTDLTWPWPQVNIQLDLFLTKSISFDAA